MRELHEEESEVQLPCSKDAFGTAAVDGLFSEPCYLCHSSVDTDGTIQLVGYEIVPSFSHDGLSSPACWE
jgi:hypothetical protein